MDENRYSIGFALRHSNSGSPVPPPAEPVPPVAVPQPILLDIRGGTRQSDPTMLDHTGTLTPARQRSPSPEQFTDKADMKPLEDSKLATFHRLRSRKLSDQEPDSAILNDQGYPEWFPSYLHLTAYGERYRAFSLDGNDPVVHDTAKDATNGAASTSRLMDPSRYNLPQLYPSRTAANMDAAGVWQSSRVRRGNPGPSSVPTSYERTPISSMSKAIAVGGGTSSASSGSTTTTTTATTASATRKEQGLLPIPKNWKSGDPNVTITPNSLSFTPGSGDKTVTNETVTVRTDVSIPPLCGVYYYEIAVKVHDGYALVSVGLCDNDEDALNRLPGMEKKSWGYHSDDGKVSCKQSTARMFGPVFGKGDVIGCGINFRKNTVFYTKNGLFLGTAFQDVRGTALYPCVGMKDGEVLETNFGSREFVFDIESYVNNDKSKVLEDIYSFEVGTEANDQFIRELIRSYLSHVGFLETAKLFNQDVKSIEQAQQLAENDGDVHMETDDEQESIKEVADRQQIRKLILAGEIDSALQLVDKEFPNTFKTDRDIEFELRCQRFIELVKKSLDRPKKNGKAKASLVSSEEPLMDAVEYGEELRRLYKDDHRPFITESLSKAFSLLVYTDPRHDAPPDVCAMLDDERLQPLAENLNSAILVSQGKPSVPSLEKLAQHATQLVWELCDNHHGPATLLNVQKDFLEAGEFFEG